MLYLPIYFVYFNSLLAEPHLSFKSSLRYANHLCFYNWWRIVFTTLFFYCGFYIAYEWSSKFYLHCLSKGPYFLTNLLFLGFILYMLVPLVAAFKVTLINDLRLRNTLIKNTPCNIRRSKHRPEK